MIAAIVLGAALLLKEQSVTATAYGCDFSGAKTVTIFAQNQLLFGENGRALTVPAAASSDGSLQFRFALPPGPFYIDYRVDGLPCSSGGEGLTILPGNDRRIALSMVQGPKGEIAWIRDWHARKFFAGTLPSLGLSVSIVVSKDGGCPDEASPERSATIDGDAYYVDYVWGMHTFLKVRSSGFDSLYIALPDASPAGSNNEYVVRNITQNDLRILATHDANVYRQCIASPSGRASRFDQ